MTVAARRAEHRLRVGGRELVVVAPASPREVLEAALDEMSRTGVEAPLPFWTRIWPSSLELARWLGDRDLRGVRVVELGAGLGVPALAAAARGADVLATDLEPAALELVSASAERSGLRVRTSALDWAQPEGHGRFDLVLGAELLYDTGLAALLANAVAGLLDPRGLAIVADPWFPMHAAFEAAVRRRGLALDSSVVEFEHAGAPRVTRRFEVRAGDPAPVTSR